MEVLLNQTFHIELFGLCILITCIQFTIILRQAKSSNPQSTFRPDICTLTCSLLMNTCDLMKLVLKDMGGGPTDLKTALFCCIQGQNDV